MKLLRELEELSHECPEEIRTQYKDNIRWIMEAKKHGMVVGSQARIYMPMRSEEEK